ncbi:hypothetical protein AAFC00_003656 [Neodothiora populina]|uniref:Uncharacterized protein n=1 Tax=Neodothiora populina TaxID=2781224 RepID=A0ABR3PEX6_9PEZI
MSFMRPLVRPGRRPIFALPVTQRPSAYQVPLASRSLSIRAIVDDLNVSSAVALLPASAMEALHTIGLPWWAVFPLSAVLIRTLVVYPLFQKPVRKAQLERIAIGPLVDAEMGFRRRQIRKAHLLVPQNKLKTYVARWLISRRLRTSMFNQATLSPRRFASIFTLIAVSDGIRRLSGHKEGLLRIFLGPFDRLSASPAPASEQNPLLDQANIGHTSTTADTAATDTTLQASASNLAIDSPWFEHDLLIDGLPWCTDLTAADPTLVLPFVFSATWFASVYFAPRLQGVNGQTGPTNMQRILMTVAILSIFPALQMPVALLMYLTTNLWVNTIQSRWLTYIMPVRRVPTACPRPVHTSSMRELADDASEFEVASSRTRR